MKKNGYSLIELMVVIAVIAILAVISFPYYQRTKNRSAAERASTNLSQDLRRAQEMATSVVEFNSQIPPGGYGIYVDLSEPDHYILFADLNENERYDAPSEMVEDIELEGEIEFSALGSGGSFYLPGVNNKVVIIFKAPDPEVIIRFGTGAVWIVSSDARIQLIFDNSFNRKLVSINETGLIYIENLTVVPAVAGSI